MSLQLQLMVGIDFTLSNGQPLSKDSLHFVDSTDRSALNAYAEAMISIADILGPYCGGYLKMVISRVFSTDWLIELSVIWIWGSITRRDSSSQSLFPIDWLNLIR